MDLANEIRMLGSYGNRDMNFQTKMNRIAQQLDQSIVIPRDKAKVYKGGFFGSLYPLTKKSDMLLDTKKPIDLGNKKGTLIFIEEVK
jgi:hypothetical protein